VRKFLSFLQCVRFILKIAKNLPLFSYKIEQNMVVCPFVPNLWVGATDFFSEQGPLPNFVKRALCWTDLPDSAASAYPPWQHFWDFFASLPHKTATLNSHHKITLIHKGTHHIIHFHGFYNSLPEQSYPITLAVDHIRDNSSTKPVVWPMPVLLFVCCIQTYVSRHSFFSPSLICS